MISIGPGLLNHWDLCSGISGPVDLHLSGTEKIAGSFGALMVLWFLILMISGVFSILKIPAVVKAVNPCFEVRKTKDELA